VIPPSATRQLSTAAERREALVEAAVAAFAEHGFHGTPTTEIAKAAGISQAYLFRLFPTKSELYVAAVDRCYRRLGDAMRAAAEDESAAGESALERMGHAYAGLMQDPTTLRATLQAFAAAAGEDLAIRDAVRRGYGELIELIRRLTGAQGDELREFVARGMLMTVLAGMDAPSIDTPWARELCGWMDEKLAAATRASGA
jgi:AcrR family transcriptional regulator